MNKQRLQPGSLLGCLLGFALISFTATAQTTAPDQWAWMGGSNTIPGSAVYGQLGVPAPGNTPGGRSGATTWTDNKGHLWLFGGTDGIAGGGGVEFNDLWEFDPASNQWAWISGGKALNSTGIYMAPGTAPGGREGAFSWVDSSGNLWLLGGYGIDGAGADGELGDLWKFDPSTSVWTFVGGGDQTCIGGGNYGTLGKPAAGNFPGCRSHGVSWVDQSGNFWLFGGQSGLTLNDLWEYNISSGEWAWMNGSSYPEGPSATDAVGVYGTLGTPNAANTPGARVEATGWTDKSGHFWLFGGLGVGSEYLVNGQSEIGNLNDLWEFDPSTNEWAWMSGSSSTDTYVGVPAVFGTLGVLAAGNVPSGRYGASGWADGKGNFWIFGGCCYEENNMSSYLDDLWVFNPNTKEWGWMNGSELIGVEGRDQGVYGELGVPAEANVPGSREFGSSWTDANGNLWLFGGYGTDSADVNGTQNDLWELEPSTSATYQAVSAPTFSPVPGNYTTGMPITLSDAVSSASIFYTTDGSTPTVSSTLYNPVLPPWANGPITTVKAIAVAANYQTSAVADATYNITLGETATVTVTPASSSIGAASSLSVVIAVSGANGNPTPTGTVTLTSGSYTSVATALTNGSATITIPANSLTVGSDTLTANYSGDSNYDSGSGNAAITVTAPPSFTVGGTAVTLAPGATTGNTSTVTVTPSGGFTGSVALTAAITSSPSGAQYPPTLSFGATTPVAINGSTGGTGTLTISTTAATTSAVLIPKRPGNPWYAAGSASLALLLFIGNMRRRSALRTLTGMLSLLVMLCGGLMACGSGGTSSGGGGGGGGGTGIAGTTAGTYTVTITGTSGTITSTGSVTLTVQ
jgi:N-acetylneuraminic acid mutarotase